MIWSSFTKKLGFCIQKTKVNAQKIDDSPLEIFGIVIASFIINDKDKNFRFFEETFLLADISMNITFEMFFLILKNIQINFNNRKLK